MGPYLIITQAWFGSNKMTVLKENGKMVLSYCENLSFNSKSDWRLPDIKELGSIVSLPDLRTTDSITINTNIFTNTKQNHYWSSTTDSSASGLESQAYNIEFSLGLTYTHNKTCGSCSYYSRCVRGGKQKIHETNWEFVDGNGSKGINKHSESANASRPEFTVLNNNLYAAWSESASSPTRNTIRVAKFDNNSSWNFVDGDQKNGLSFTLTEAANNPFPIAYKNQLYVAWIENNEIRVSRMVSKLSSWMEMKLKGSIRTVSFMQGFEDGSLKR